MKKTFIYVVTVWSALNETPSTCAFNNERQAELFYEQETTAKADFLVSINGFEPETKTVYKEGSNYKTKTRIWYDWIQDRDKPSDFVSLQKIELV